jgi:hypothetical protein
MLQEVYDAPATMIPLMNSVLSGLIGNFVFLYLDDIIVFSDSKELYKQHLLEVFQRLNKWEFKVNEQKGNRFKRRIELLGNVIDNGNLLTSNGNIKTIEDFRTPNNKSELQTFLGT